MIDAAVWTLIALLGASSFGGIFYLGSRIDAVNARLDSVIDRLGGLDAREARLETRVGSLESKIDTHVDRHVP